MSALILTGQDSKLFLREGQICCKIAGKPGKLLPWKGIDQIVLDKHVEISTQLILRLAEKGISMFIHGTKHKEIAALVPLKAPASAIKLIQYRIFSDKECCQRLSIMLLKIRTSMQIKNLKKFGLPVEQWIFEQFSKLETGNNLMLQEAGVSKYYWRQITAILGEWGFQGRARRPPIDPVNALLSLSSVMVDSLYNHALLVAGLDLGLGFHHKTGYRRQSLICDLKELSRGDLEYWVISLFLNNQLSSDHFTYGLDGCRLNREGSSIFYKAWYSFASQHQKQVNRIAKLAKKIIVREMRYAK